MSWVTRLSHVTSRPNLSSCHHAILPSVWFQPTKAENKSPHFVNGVLNETQNDTLNVWQKKKRLLFFDVSKVVLFSQLTLRPFFLFVFLFHTLHLSLLRSSSSCYSLFAETLQKLCFLRQKSMQIFSSSLSFSLPPSLSLFVLLLSLVYFSLNKGVFPLRNQCKCCHWFPLSILLFFLSPLGKWLFFFSLSFSGINISLFCPLSLSRSLFSLSLVVSLSLSSKCVFFSETNANIFPIYCLFCVSCYTSVSLPLSPCVPMPLSASLARQSSLCAWLLHLAW